jgi:tRNA nucleotidyltransferase/poly(A) polymerase
MVRTSEDIARCSVPRVTEDLYRLAESGHAARAFTLMADCGALAVMLPAVRHRSRLRALVSILGRVAAGRGRRKPRLSTAERMAMPQALTLMRLLHRRDGSWVEHYERWRALAVEWHLPWVPVSEPPERGADPPRSRSRRRRRRPRRRRQESVDA